MNYYKLYSQISFPDRWFLGDINVDDNWVFTDGIGVDASQFKNLDIEIDQKGISLDYTVTNVYAVPIVSEKFSEWLYEYSDEIQLIPVSIPNTIENYFILVVKNKIECVDEALSNFLIFEKGNDVRPDKVRE